jgi:Tfp pilus assembly protein PilF
MKWALPAATMILALAACETAPQVDADEGFDEIDLIEEANLTDLMLSLSDPADAVSYFEAALTREPQRVDYKRGYAQALARAARYTEAARIYEDLNATGQAQTDDRLVYTEVLIRENRFEEAAIQLELLPTLTDEYRYNLLNALVADHYSRWADSDRYYDQAQSLTTRPGPVLNNWGVSHLSRGDNSGAMDLFERSVALDPGQFGPKNNLTITRGLEGIYTLPVVPMTEEERAQLYHNLALVALRQGEEDVAKGLLRAAVNSHPRFFPAAADKLEALEAVVER